MHVTTKGTIQEMLKGLLYKVEEKIKTELNKMVIKMYLSINNLHVNGLNAIIKVHRVAEWSRKKDSYIFCLKRTTSE